MVEDLERITNKFLRTNDKCAFKDLLAMLIYRNELKLAKTRFKQFIQRGGEIDEEIADYGILLAMLTLDIDLMDDIISTGLVPIKSKLKVFVNFYGYMNFAESLLDRCDIDEICRNSLLMDISRMKAKPAREQLKLKGIINKADKALYYFKVLMYQIFSGKLKFLEEMNDHLKKLGELRLFSTTTVLELYKSLFEKNLSSLYLVEKTYKEVGDNYRWVLTKIFQSFLVGKDLLEKENCKINPKIRVLYTNYRIVKRYIDGTPFDTPDELKGFEYFWWIMDKVKGEKRWINFSGELALYEGAKKITPPERRKKILVGYAFVKVFKSLDALYHFQNVIFPKSKNRKKSVWKLKSRVVPLLRIPHNLKMSLDYGCFLDEEEDEWAKVLKEKVRV